jgi:hypothetical protein
MGVVRGPRGTVALAVLVAATVLAIGADVGYSDSPSSDWAVSLSGPSGYGGVGDVATYTVTATNRGPDPSEWEWSLSAGWSGGPGGPSGAASFVSSDDACTYAPASNGVPDTIHCGSPPAPIAVGTTQTIHFSIKWTAAGNVTVGAGVGNYVPTNDPNLDNNSAGLGLFICPSGCTPIGPGGGGGGGGGSSPPTATFKFIDQIPRGEQYRRYYADLNSCDYPPATCTDSAETTLIAGIVPPGVTLGPSAQIFGIPTTPGTYSFTVEAAQDFGSQGIAKIRHDYTLVVDPYRSTAEVSPPPTRLTLPNRRRTPGVANPAVTQKTIKTTICVANWTKKIRPPVSYTNKLKLKQMTQYDEEGSPTAYEEDYLIPLELGGAARNPKNLWPEPRSQSKHSDPLETSVRRKVCAGKLTLAAGRKQILAYKRTHG